jgi:hypothetical protein
MATISPPSREPLFVSQVAQEDEVLAGGAEGVAAHQDLAVGLEGHTARAGVLLVVGAEVGERHASFAERGVEGAVGVVPHHRDLRVVLWLASRGRTSRSWKVPSPGPGWADTGRDMGERTGVGAMRGPRRVPMWADRGASGLDGGTEG